MRALLLSALLMGGCVDVAAPTMADVDGAEPGPARRFSALIHTSSNSACSQSWSSFGSRASFVLTLESDGSASACRGRAYEQSGGGWEDGIPFTHRVREQQGYRGAWRALEGGALDVELRVDDGVCEPLRADPRLEALDWHLVCRDVTGEETLSSVAERVIACELAEPVYTEALGYTTRGVIDGEPMLLGTGPGLRTALVDDSDMSGTQSVRVERSPTPIDEASWTE